MKYIIDTDKLPCNNGKNCTTCPFWSVDDTCEITEQVKKLPKYEEIRPHGEWIDEGVYADNVGKHVYLCTHCNEHIVEYPSEMGSYCKYCGSDNRPRKQGCCFADETCKNNPCEDCGLREGERNEHD